MRDDNDHHLSGKKSSADDLLSELDSIKELLDEELQQPRAAAVSEIEEIGSVEEYLRIKEAANAAGLDIEAYLSQQSEEPLHADELELVEDDDTLPIVDEIITIDEDEDEDETEIEDQGGDSLLIELAEEEKSPSPSAAATSVEEYFAAVVAAKHQKRATPSAAPSALDLAMAATAVEIDKPLPDETVEQQNESPLLEEIGETDETSADDGSIPVLAEVATGEGVPSAGSSISLEDMQELVDLLVNRKLQQLKPELEREVINELQKLIPLSSLPKS